MKHCLFAPCTLTFRNGCKAYASKGAMVGWHVAVSSATSKRIQVTPCLLKVAAKAELWKFSSTFHLGDSKVCLLPRPCGPFTVVIMALAALLCFLSVSGLTQAHGHQRSLVKRQEDSAVHNNPFASLSPSNVLEWSPCYVNSSASLLGPISCARLLVGSVSTTVESSANPCLCD